MTDQEKLDCMNKMKEMEDKIKSLNTYVTLCRSVLEFLMSCPEGAYDIKSIQNLIKPLIDGCVELTKEE